MISSLCFSRSIPQTTLDKLKMRFGFGLGIFFLSALITLPAQAQIPIFVDNFDNGVASNSDTITAFWTPITNAYSAVTEPSGKLVITAGDASTYTGVVAPRMYSGNPSDEYNFFKRKLRFSADVTIAGDVPSQSNLRFALSGGAGSIYYEEDALAVLFTADQKVTFSYKQDRSYTGVESGTKLVNAVAIGGPVTGFDLTLDSTNYTLVVRYQGGAGASTFSGTHGMYAVQWGVDGKSTMQFETVRSATTAAGQVTTATVDNFLVSNMEPLGLFQDSFSNNNVTNSDVETGIWTSTTAYTSTVSEANGVLLQKATSAATEYALVNTTTPVQSRFNFFDQQLRFRISNTISGTTSQTYMMRSRFALASQAGSATAANDAFVIAARSDNNILLGTKMDAPAVNPEDTWQTANKYPFNGTTADATVYFGSVRFNNIDLSLNSKRYRLMASCEDPPNSSNTRGSNVMRFSGAHLLDRTKWGANGDSALMLETVRTGETTAGTAANTTWDNLRVDADSTKMLAEPFWTFAATYSAVFSATESGTFRLWLPTTEPVIRGIIFIGPGDGGNFQFLAHDLAAQEAARAMGFGLIGYTSTARMNLSAGDYPVQIKAAVQTVLDRAAAVSGHPELSNVPICITGFSRGSFDSCYLVHSWPERVIAFVPFCGGEWSNPTLTAAAKKVPGLFLPGSVDTNGATNPFLVQNMFTWWRSQGAQVAYCVNWNISHNTGGNQGWEAMLSWMVEVAKLRYPRPMAPSATAAAGTFPTLLNIDDASGWLGDRATFTAANTPGVTNVFTPISPYASYTGTAGTASWLPNETTARVYRATTSTDRVSRTSIPTHSPLRIVSPTQFAEPIAAGTSVVIEVDPRDFDNTNALASMDFYDGETWLGALTSGPVWKWTFAPTAGWHTLSVVATDVLGNKRDAFRTLNVIPANFPPLAYGKTMTATSNTDTAGTVTGLDPEGNSVTYALAQAPAHGTVTMNTSGSYTYRSNPGYGGSDSFTFTANDGAVTGDPGVVTVTVNVDPVGALSSLNAATGPNAAQITLTWSAATNAEKYVLERSTLSNSGFLTTATISAPTLFYTDGSLTRDTTYYYRVKATNPVSQSAYSPTASAIPYVPATSDGWRYINFGSPQVVAGVSGDLDTPHHDGITNLMKCALGISIYNAQGQPVAVSPTSMPYVQEQVIDNNQYLTCTFTHNKSATDLVVRIQVANDPNGPWTDMDPFNAANQISVTDNTPSVGTETIVVKDTQAIGATSKRFMRVRVTRP